MMVLLLLSLLLLLLHLVRHLVALVVQLLLVIMDLLLLEELAAIDIGRPRSWPPSGRILHVHVTIGLGVIVASIVVVVGVE